MWAILYLTIDGRLICKREIWLTVTRGCWAKKKRRDTIDEATQLLKKRYSGLLATCNSYEIMLHLGSRVNDIIKTIPF